VASLRELHADRGWRSGASIWILHAAPVAQGLKADLDFSLLWEEVTLDLSLPWEEVVSPRSLLTRRPVVQARRQVSAL